MKKTASRLLAMVLAGSLALAGCGGSGTTSTTAGSSTETTAATTAASGTTETTASAETPETTGKYEIKDLVIPRLATREIETFNILYSQSFSDFENLVNLTDALLEVDTQGKLVPALAEEWGTDDNGLTWKFKVREGVKWVDKDANVKADCTARDFATGLEWVLNYYKNESSHTSVPIELIEGAGDYYEYTKSLTQEEAYALNAEDGSKFLEMVGVEIPDELTIIYHCTEAIPYFDSVATWAGLYPMAQGMIDELTPDGVKSMNNETMWYNGCYTMTSYVQGNEKIFTKNPTYWDKDCTLFDTVTVKMVDSNDVAFQLYQNGEIDYVDLTESNLKIISENPSNEFHDYLVQKPADKYSYQMRFNYNKNLDSGEPDTNWNTAIANEAFRKAIYYGLDLSEYYKRFNAINPMSCENNFYSMKGLIYTTDGTDYTELVRKAMNLPELNGESMVRIDKDKAASYKAQAIEELTALDVTFPVSLDYYISGTNQTALDSANILKQAFVDGLGDDFIQFNIKTYVSSASQEVYNPRLQSISVSGWGADYGDPQTYLSQELYGYDNAYYSVKYTNINSITEETPENKALLDTYKEYTKMIEDANKIVDNTDTRQEAYAQAEAYLLDHVLTLPLYYNVGWCLTRINPYSKMNAMFGCQNDKMKNWETCVDGYTTAETAQ
ncbi:MAG: ABC transporter substrate-binding protein [bacterium]|nr:ABC transporter substrate-binding protein [bacterium]